MVSELLSLFYKFPEYGSISLRKVSKFVQKKDIYVYENIHQECGTFNGVYFISGR